MKKLILPLLFLCLLLSACTQSIAPTQLQIPSLPPATPVTTVPVTSPTVHIIPTTVPPTFPLPTETAVQETKRTVTPRNTYVFAEYPDGRPCYENRVSLDTDTRIPDYSTIQPGQVILSDNVKDGIRANPIHSVFYVAVCFRPSIDWELGEYPYGNQYNDLRKEIMQRFQDANYHVVNGGSYCETLCMFYLLASAEQLSRLHCGDDIGVYVYIPDFAC